MSQVSSDKTRVTRICACTPFITYIKAYDLTCLIIGLQVLCREHSSANMVELVLKHGTVMPYLDAARTWSPPGRRVGSSRPWAATSALPELRRKLFDTTSI